MEEFYTTLGQVEKKKSKSLQWKEREGEREREIIELKQEGVKLGREIGRIGGVANRIGAFWCLEGMMGGQGR